MLRGRGEDLRKIAKNAVVRAAGSALLSPRRKNAIQRSLGWTAHTIQYCDGRQRPSVSLSANTKPALRERLP